MAAMEQPSLVASVLWSLLGIGLTALPGVLGGCWGILTQDFLGRLARFMVTFMSPCLILSSLGTRLRRELVWQLVPLLFWSGLQVLAGQLVAALLLRASGDWAKGKGRSETLARLLELAVSFQNVGSFNLILMQTLCDTPGLFPEHAAHCYQDSILLVFGYTICWDVALWTYGYSTLLAMGRHGSDEKKSASSQELFLALSAKREATQERQEDVGDEERRPRSRPLRLLSCLLRRRAELLHTLEHCFNPVLVALMLSFVVGVTPPLQGALFGQGGCLRPLGEALKRIGQPVPMLGLQILGGTLGCAVREMWSSGRKEEKVLDLTTSQLRSWVLMTMSGKLLLLPALGFLAFLSLSGLQHVQANHMDNVDQVGQLQGAQGLLRGQPDALQQWSAMSTLLWPQDRLLRTLVLAQWSAPSCLNLIVLGHRVGLEESCLQSLAILYIAMYFSTTLTSTVWLTAGLSIF